MTTETDRARPRNLGRIDPALRDTAASLDIPEFRTESLPAEREAADWLPTERRPPAAAASRSTTAPSPGLAGNRSACGFTVVRARRRHRWWCTPTAVAS